MLFIGKQLAQSNCISPSKFSIYFSIKIHFFLFYINTLQKHTHQWCKIVHLCTIAIVTMHICTVIVALAFIILLVYFFSPSLCLSGCSHSHLTLIATDHQRTPHHASTENLTSKNFFQNQVKQEISITQDLFGCREKNTEKQEIKKINQTQRKSTLFHHFLTNQTRNKEN